MDQTVCCKKKFVACCFWAKRQKFSSNFYTPYWTAWH